MGLYSETDFIEAGALITKGAIALAATETFYALATSPFSPAGLDRLNRLKQRPHQKTIPLIAASRKDVEEVILSPGDLASELMTRFWPGSLTILLASYKAFPDEVTGPGKKIAVRAPPPCPALDLAACSGGWITSTSANISGEPPAVEAGHVRASIVEAIEIVFDTGRAPGGAPSTIVEPLNNGIRLLREGAVPSSLIERTLGLSLIKS
jgi:L-threonylcarbamoyladenylate synthase